MDKNAIKKYAVWAREELIKRVSAKATQYGIEKDNIIDANADNVNGVLITLNEKKQRADLITQIKNKGYEQIVEEVAYTWFNRFIALRFMEVNNYLPTHIRVFTDEENNFNPQIMTEAIHLELDGLDIAKVLEFKEQNKNDELYKYLLITQCNALNSILPHMFQRISDYTELLFPDNILLDGSVIQQMIELIPEEDFKDAVQIIGWLYQYYSSVPKDIVFANLKKNIKIKKEDIPAATQLFTPDWIVRYMVENSLGRLWYEGHPNDELKSNWKYYLDEAEQEQDVQLQLDEIREENKNLKPEEIKCIDPCMGSGHILVYMFDVLMQIYESYGYNSRDAVVSILENNLYGLDIDDRAAQLAYFAIMMKARAYDRRFFSRAIQPHIYAIPDYLDWKEYGSLVKIDEMPQRPIIESDKISMGDANNDFLNTVVDVAEVLTQKYDVVITNPPYMGASGMGAKLSDFVKKHYPDSKSDLSTCFMEKTIEMCTQNGYMSMINIPVWMFLSSYEKLRKNIAQNNTYTNMVHFGRGVFGSDFGTTSFVIAKKQIEKYSANYRRLFEKQGAVDSVEQKEKWFFEGVGTHITQQENFSKIPSSPIAYWVSENFIKAFEENQISDYATVTNGMFTCDNKRFLRLWNEIEYNNFYLNCDSKKSCQRDERKWYPYNKGGNFRRWYGNHEYVINFKNFGEEISRYRVDSGQSKSFPGQDFYFKESLSWSLISSSKFGIRYYPQGFVFDIAGSSIFVNDDNKRNMLLGILASEVSFFALGILNPTINYQAGDIKSLPVIISEQYQNFIDELVEQNISLSKTDWDSFETSWDFKVHPLVENIFRVNGKRNVPTHIEDCFVEWKKHCDTQFNQLKANEEKLNEIFIEIYGLQDELTPEVEDKDVTVRKADLQRDIKSFISYAVGCMFVRYSLDVDGLVYAGGNFNEKWKMENEKCYVWNEKISNFQLSTFNFDIDNIIPICDDEYFEDDIVGRFIDFVKVVYGTETLEENLRFIADALGGKGSPKEVIRNYFLNDFYKDHCKIYQKRPIYWLFDSGKKNGFKALIYMHRYAPDTLARMRTDYVHEQQGRYRTAISDLERRINDATTAERVKLAKQLTKIKDQETELRLYEERIHHLADKMITIDLDDGVKHNYEIFKDVLANIK